jgi:hypothetical protein
MFAFASKLLTVVLAVQRYVTDAYPFKAMVFSAVLLYINYLKAFSCCHVLVVPPL